MEGGSGGHHAPINIFPPGWGWGSENTLGIRLNPLELNKASRKLEFASNSKIDYLTNSIVHSWEFVHQNFNSEWEFRPSFSQLSDPLGGTWQSPLWGEY